MRIMAIDYGDARTGIAISDAAGLLAGFTTVIHSRSREGMLREIQALVQTRQVDGLVLGLPRNMDGTEGPRAQLCRDFAGQLAALTGLTPVLWDERRTTVEAHGILHAGGKKMKAHRKTVDAVAATLILEGYLTRRRLQSGP
ncbi:Holliday junction resolvase RuvX [Pseudoflavonifractor sp. 524-17]|uniref:Holliday junction resolvase RuvX n=1 Tax=Pseudoflavonifractor sp. 524-17 TaxID=2304577 RepID=UPI00137A2B3A|nr:Holliday junction resolvase RuvX [Pseudoflavonifractor sp. 524-17]NCE63282.1 Holliday junction resolvase RuvX [Pseudoflavonifractor sp. 524-17]